MEAVLAAESYHYPTELLTLLVDTIPLICRSKRDVIQFFQAAGVPSSIWTPWSSKLSMNPGEIKKHEIARAVLNAVNQGESNPLLRARRELLKRLVEWSDFGVCWPNDRERAELFVRRIRELVDQKDAFTRINKEREAERERTRPARREQMEDLEKKRSERQRAKAKLFAVFAESDPWKRGTLLEAAINDVFKAHGILIKESFVLRTEDGQIREQIDGAIELESHLYLVEVRCREAATGAEDIARHLSRVQYRSGARGIFISVSRFTEPAEVAFIEAHQSRVHIALQFHDLVPVLEEDLPLAPFLHQRVQSAILQKNPFAK